MIKKKLTVNKKIQPELAQLLFMIWAQFNQANEPANCIGLVYIPKFCGSVERFNNPFVKL